VGENLESQNESLDGNARFHFVFYRVYEVTSLTKLSNLHCVVAYRRRHGSSRAVQKLENFET